jgi:hypothetical protein
MTAKSEDSDRDWLELVREKVQTLRFGVVQIVVHDSKVTQIERTEKTRLDVAAASRKNSDSVQTTGDRRN